MTTLDYQEAQGQKPVRSFSRITFFLVLFAAGMAGVATLWFLPLPIDIELPASETAVRISMLVQSAILLAIAVTIGLFTAPKVGLTAPVFHAFATGGPKWPALAPQLWPGLIGGLLGALMLLTYALLQPLITPELVNSNLATDMPMLTRVLFGGVTEELLIRWGGMSLLVWLGWRLLQSGQGTPHHRWFWMGIVLAAILFGVNHLPAAVSFGMLLTPLRIGFIILFNALVGVLYGWLYWRRGLEAAMIAHAFTHIIAIWFLLPMFGIT